MILGIWLLLAGVSLGLFGFGLFFAKAEQIMSGKLIVLALAFIFQITTAISAFNIEKVGFGDTVTITSVHAYPSIALFFIGLALLNLAMMFFYTWEIYKQEVLG